MLEGRYPLLGRPAGQVPGPWSARAATILPPRARRGRVDRNAELQLALAAQRERIARDLHDGLAQDLAFIAAHGERLAAEHGSEHPLAVAARRALSVVRGAILDLSASDQLSTAAALSKMAEELGGRHGVAVEVRARAEPDEDPARREHLVRITREAIVNAIRHGRASRVAVELGRPGEERMLRIWDNGCGLGRARTPGGTGRGLATMRARAAVLGAQLVARSAGSGGTEITLRGRR